MLGNVPLLTERLWMALTSSAIRKVQLSHDLTDQDCADHMGCCAATVGNARNQAVQIAGRTLFNALRIDPLAIEGLLHHFGRRSVPIEARCDTDPLVTMAGAVHKIAEAQSEGSPGGKAITDGECLALESYIDAAMASMTALKSRALDIRRERAG